MALRLNMFCDQVSSAKIVNEFNYDCLMLARGCCKVRYVLTFFKDLDENKFVSRPKLTRDEAVRSC